MRKPKDRDYIETVEGLLFCVVGYLHPPDKYTAYLKYSPVAQGKWRRGEVAYRRELAYYHALQVGETMAYLRREYPHYVHRCPVRDMAFSFVPQDYVERYYRPEERLREILTAPRDPLEEEVTDLVRHLSSRSGIPPDALGITGSLLVRIHNPAFSDIDLIVYGLENVWRVKEMMDGEPAPPFSRLDEEYLADWRRLIAGQFSLSDEEARHVERRHWNVGYFGARRRFFSLHPTRSDAEITERYGEHFYRDVGMAHLRAAIADAGESLFLPARYIVEQVEVIAGPDVQGAIGEIISHEGIFCHIADAGQRVEAYGKLEQIDGGPAYRLVVGTTRNAGPEYIKPVNE
jgi:predicted nucleotidyltransferase